MKITFSLPPFSPRPVGGFRVVYEYSNRLVQRGHEVTIVHILELSDASPGIGRRLRTSVGRAARAISKPNLWWQTLDERVKVLHLPRRMLADMPDSDVIFATAWTTARPVLDGPARKGMKFYLVQDFDPWIASRDALQETWRWPFKKITVSNWLREKVLASGASPGDTLNIPVAVDHARFRMTEAVEGRPRRVAMLYGSSEYKSPEVGLRALEIAKARCSELEATVFGHEPRPSPMPPWIDYRRDLQETDLVRLYNQSALYLCCSLAEGFALPPAEAAACGCAIVSTDCGGIGEYAEPGITALLSPPSDSQALADNIVRAMTDEDLRQGLARAAHRRIQDFTWQRSTDLLESFISKPDVLPARSPGTCP